MDDFDLISLRPSQPVGTGGLLPSRSTLIALAIAVMLLIVGLAGFVWSNGKVSTAANAKQVADAQKQQVELQAQRVKDELKKLEGSGGSQRLTTIGQVLDSRTDWPKVILTIGRSAPAGLTLGGFTGATGAAGTAAGAAAGAPDPATSTGNVLNLAGQAPSTAAVNQFIRALRRNPDVIEQVDLQGAARSGKVTSFTLAVTIKMPDPLSTTSSTTTDPNAGGGTSTPEPTP